MVRWSKEEETILVDTVLRCVREGSTQSAAFQEAAEQLGRTPQACAFRWNHQLRRQHEAALNLAKENCSPSLKCRKTGIPIEPDFHDFVASINALIRFLRFLRNRWIIQRRRTKELQDRIRKQDELIRSLQYEIRILRQRMPGTVFRMESNGNLVRIEGRKR